MSWKTSDGKAIDATGEHEVAGGDMKPMPENTKALAFIDEAKWSEARGGEMHISLRWRVLLPDQFKNRVVFQKLWVYDANPNAKDAQDANAKRDKALTMLANIDKNAGGHLQATGNMPTPLEIDDRALAKSLMNKQMFVTFGAWEMKAEDGKTIDGNWVRRVEPKGAVSDVPLPSPTQAVAAPATTRPIVDDDEIPF
jgi:hypothetical protein